MAKITDIHVSIPDHLLEGINRIARERRTRRAQVVRQALDEFLARCEAERIQRQMDQYVEALADQSGEFIAETDAHTVRRLLKETKW